MTDRGEALLDAARKVVASCSPEQREQLAGHTVAEIVTGAARAYYSAAQRGEDWDALGPVGYSDAPGSANPQAPPVDVEAAFENFMLSYGLAREGDPVPPGVAQGSADGLSQHFSASDSEGEPSAEEIAAMGEAWERWAL